MSFVYSTVIQIGGFENNKEEVLNKLNGWLKEQDHLGVEFKYLDGKDSAGTKSPEIYLLWGGFNYLNVSEFIDFFKSLKLKNSLLTITPPEQESYVAIVSGAELETK